MLWTYCPPTIWANSLEFSRNRLKLSADKMYRACELKDQTYKKTRTLHFSQPMLFLWSRGFFWSSVAAILVVTWGGASQGAPHEMATLKARAGAFDASNRESGAPGKVKYNSSGASGGSLQGGASFKVEKAHFSCMKKGSGEPQKWSKIAPPPLCRPLKHSMNNCRPLGSASWRTLWLQFHNKNTELIPTESKSVSVALS